AVPTRPAAEPVLGRHAPLCARRLRLARACFADSRAGAIAIDAGRADVDEALRYNPRFCQRRDEACRSRIVAAFGRWRREMQHCKRRRPQALEAVIAIEI